MRSTVLFFLIIMVSVLSIMVFILPIFADSSSEDYNICQSDNCENNQGICSEGYYCFLTESNIPEDIRCSSNKVTAYLDQKIDENRFSIEIDSSHMERYGSDFMREQLKKGCFLSELKPLFIEGTDHITLTTEFINYQPKGNLDVTINWFLTPKSTGEEINVTRYCTQKITLLEKEDRIINCTITNPSLLTDTEYTYKATGTYDLKEGGTETISSKDKQIIHAKSIADSIASAANSLKDSIFGGLSDLMNKALGKTTCDKNPEICSKFEGENFCYLLNDSYKGLKAEDMITELSKNKDSKLIQIPSDYESRVRAGCLPKSLDGYFGSLKTQSVESCDQKNECAGCIFNGCKWCQNPLIGQSSCKSRDSSFLDCIGGSYHDYNNYCPPGEFLDCKTLGGSCSCPEGQECEPGSYKEAKDCKETCCVCVDANPERVCGKILPLNPPDAIRTACDEAEGRFVSTSGMECWLENRKLYCQQGFRVCACGGLTSDNIVPYMEKQGYSEHVDSNVAQAPTKAVDSEEWAAIETSYRSGCGVAAEGETPGYLVGDQCLENEFSNAKIFFEAKTGYSITDEQAKLLFTERVSYYNIADSSKEDALRETIRGVYLLVGKDALNEYIANSKGFFYYTKEAQLTPEQMNEVYKNIVGEEFKIVSRRTYPEIEDMYAVQN